MNKNIINELAGKLADAVPRDSNLHELRHDLEQNFRALLQSGLDKLDLVTREEFDVQRKVLERTREKLQRLETELDELQRDTIGNTGSSTTASPAPDADKPDPTDRA